MVVVDIFKKLELNKDEKDALKNDTDEKKKEEQNLVEAKSEKSLSKINSFNSYE